MTKTFDHKQVIAPYGLEDVDVGFLNWWKDIAALSFINKNGEKVKVPVFFFSQERWYKSRQEGVRDQAGTLIIPVISITRTEISDDTSSAFSRTYADIQNYRTIYKEADLKSSRLANLVKAQSGSVSINPRAKIYELYSVPVPDHYNITYEVNIWAPYIEDMNSFIEKLGQSYNYKSKKSFVFNLQNGIYMVAHKSDEILDDSNLEDFSASERIIRKELTYQVSAHIIPEVEGKRSPMRRYFSQSRIVIKDESIVSGKDLDKYFK